MKLMSTQTSHICWRLLVLMETKFQAVAENTRERLSSGTVDVHSVCDKFGMRLNNQLSFSRMFYFNLSMQHNYTDQNQY